MALDYAAKCHQLTECGWHRLQYLSQPLWLHPQLTKKDSHGNPSLVCTREAWNIQKQHTTKENDNG